MSDGRPSKISRMGEPPDSHPDSMLAEAADPATQHLPHTSESLELVDLIFPQITVQLPT
jgi:hypothetical protein